MSDRLWNFVHDTWPRFWYGVVLPALTKNTYFFGTARRRSYQSVLDAMRANGELPSSEWECLHRYEHLEGPHDCDGCCPWYA